MRAIDKSRVPKEAQDDGLSDGISGGRKLYHGDQRAMKYNEFI